VLIVHSDHFRNSIFPGGMTINTFVIFGCEMIRSYLVFFVIFHALVSSFRNLNKYGLMRRILSKEIKLCEEPLQNSIEVEPYSGPQSTFEKMISGFDLEELGLTLMTGESTVAKGKGLFICLQDGVEETFLEKGTILSGYSKGHFGDTIVGDKSVTCVMDDLSGSVIFQQEIIPLYEAVERVCRIVGYSHNVVHGHTLTLNGSDASISPDLSYQDRYFCVADDNDTSSIISIGKFANDLAYHPHLTNETEYLKQSESKNILALLIRLDIIDQKLKPTWPVIVFKQDVLFLNKEPMEIGLQYSWSYWISRRLEDPLI
jgi:hypothetical protein